MLVAYFQIFFIVTITASFLVGRVLRGRGNRRWWIIPASYTTLCVLWTSAQVVMLPLSIVQMSVIAVTVFLNMNSVRKADDRRKQAARLADLEQLLAKLDEELTERERELLEAVPKHRLRLLITKEEHERALYDEIAKANRTLFISSGWMNDRVVNRRLLGALRQALRRGVHVFIVFGYKSKYEEPKLDSSSRRAVQALDRLAQETAGGKGGRLLLAYVGVHAKVVVRDQEVGIMGSHNWLSNSAWVNAERSVVVTDEAFVTEMQQDLALLAREALADSVDRLLGRTSPAISV